MRNYFWFRLSQWVSKCDQVNERMTQQTGNTKGPRGGRVLHVRSNCVLEWKLPGTGKYQNEKVSTTRTEIPA